MAPYSAPLSPASSQPQPWAWRLVEVSWPEMGQATVTLHTHSCTSLHTHAHTKWTAPSPADTLGHMHTGAAHSPLHTDTPTPAPAPTPTHLHPHPPPITVPTCPASCQARTQPRRVQAAAGVRGDGAGGGALELGPARGPGCPRLPLRADGPPLVQEGGLGEGFGAQSSPGAPGVSPPPPAGLTGHPWCREAGWGAMRLAGSRF